MRYSAEAQRLLLIAAERARQLGHSYVGSAHLLLALSSSPETAGQLLRYAGGTPELLTKLAAVLYGVGTADLPLPQGFSEEAAGLLQSAAVEARLCGSGQIKVIHILLSLLRQESTAARDLMLFCGVDAPELFSNIRVKLLK